MAKSSIELEKKYFQKYFLTVKDILSFLPLTGQILIPCNDFVQISWRYILSLV